MSSTTYAIVDCNNFYVSCEQVFNPKLKGKAVVILSNNDGMIIARSQEAKSLGIRMGAALFEYNHFLKTNSLIALSSNFSLYADMSKRVMEVLEQYSNTFEIYSIDEAFVPQIDRETALDLRLKILKWIGIPVSIGIGPTKTLAKIAGEKAKKLTDGVYKFENMEEVNQILKSLPPQEVWGIGEKLKKSLLEEKIFTAHQFATQDLTWVRAKMGITGVKMALELRGIKAFDLQREEKKKSIVVSRSFSPVIRSKVKLEGVLSSFCARAAEKLRKQKSKARFISIFATTSPFESSYESFNWSLNLPFHSSYTPEFISCAKLAIRSFFKEEKPIKKAGILLGDFIDESYFEEDLLGTDLKSEIKLKRMKILDELNSKYPNSKVRFLSQDPQSASKRANISQRYTTSWNELLKIN
jgi:DNA polymerase V